jgi:hypothetical protein
MAIQRTTSSRPSFCASSIINDDAGADHRLFGKSRCSRLIASTDSAMSPA